MNDDINIEEAKTVGYGLILGTPIVLTVLGVLVSGFTWIFLP